MDTPCEDDKLILLRFAIATSEARLSAQLTSALAADQRAMVFAGIMVAAAVALGAGLGTLLTADPIRLELVLTAGIVASLLVASIFLALRASRPVDFWLPGLNPVGWEKDLAAEKVDVEGGLEGYFNHLQKRIVENRQVMEKNAKLLHDATGFALAGVMAGALLLIGIGLLDYVAKQMCA